MAKKKGIINNEDKMIALTNAESALHNMKLIERNKKKNLKRIDIPNGYIMTSDVGKWINKTN